MRTFKELMIEAEDQKAMSSMRNWIGHRLDNTDMSHGQMKSEFIKKFGSKYAKHFDQIVSDMVD